MIESPLMTLKEAADYLKVGRESFRQRYKNYTPLGLKVVKLGRRVLVRKDSLDEVIKQAQINW